MGGRAAVSAARVAGPASTGPRRSRSLAAAAAGMRVLAVGMRLLLARGNGSVGQVVGGALEGIAWIADLHAARRLRTGHRAIALLHHVGQLVSHHPPAFIAVRLVGPL